MFCSGRAAPDFGPALDQCSGHLAGPKCRWCVLRLPISAQPGIGLDAQRHAPNLPHEDSDSGHRAGVLGATEPHIVVPFRGCVPVPVCRSHILRFIVPGATADHKKRPTPYGWETPAKLSHLSLISVSLSPSCLHTHSTRHQESVLGGVPYPHAVRAQSNCGSVPCAAPLTCARLPPPRDTAGSAS
jgi:hypothetical protein